MPDWFSLLLRERTVHHVSDMVNIAIGVNLLFPVASSFLKCFLDGIEIEPERIVEKYFDNQPVNSGDLQEVAVAAQAIEAERTRCSPLSWKWWLADAASACGGMFILLGGWEELVGLWCLLLFLPACLAIGCSAWRYMALRKVFFHVVEKIRNQISTRKKCESQYVKDYVKKCQDTIRQNRGRKNASSK